METQTLRLFQCVKEKCETMGINLSHLNQNCSINWKILVFFVPTLLFLISSTVYMVYMADSVLEFNDSFFINLTAVLNFASTSILIREMPIILELIAKLERTIEKSELYQIKKKNFIAVSLSRIRVCFINDSE